MHGNQVICIFLVYLCCQKSVCLNDFDNLIVLLRLCAVVSERKKVTLTISSYLYSICILRNQSKVRLHTIHRMSRPKHPYGHCKEKEYTRPALHTKRRKRRHTATPTIYTTPKILYILQRIFTNFLLHYRVALRTERTNR